MTLIAASALHSLAARQTHWLGVRQTVIAQNIAQASTPGYKARDLAAFQEVLSRSPDLISRTHAAHLGGDGATASRFPTREAEAWETSHSGNTVSLDQEMLRASEIGRAFALNTAVLKTFQKLWLAGSK